MNRAERLILLKDLHKKILARQKIDRLEELEDSNQESSLSFSNFGIWLEDGLIKGH